MATPDLAADPSTAATWLSGNEDLPRADLERLLCERLAISRSRLITHPDLPLGHAHKDQLDHDVASLRAGKPLAYVLGEWGFWDFSVLVNRHVLIPRPETETLVEEALRDADPAARILDLGTGSGVVACALARALPNATVVAVDRSPEAIAVARENAGRMDARVEFRLSDWFSAVPETFDLIVANPPYVAEGDPHLPALAFEPMEALVSGPEGLDALASIISGAPAHLNPGGRLVVEHGYDQADSVERLFETAGFTDIHLTRDLGGQPRVTAGRLKGERA
jgi:release factor glutamine methyltransferase